MDRRLAQELDIEVHGPRQVPPPQIERAGLGYVARFIDFDLELRVRHLRWEHEELRGSLTVSTTYPSAHLFAGSFNLSSLRSRSELARHLAKRWAADWDSVLEMFCLAVVTQDEQGEPAGYLRDAVAPTHGNSALPPLLLARHPVIWFGDGGAAKSLLALAAALSLHEGIDLLGLQPTGKMRVAYCDWELDDVIHKQRMKRLLGGELPDEAMPDILYVRCQQSLSRELDRLGHLFADHGIQYVVIDSISWACDGAPEEAASAKTFFETLRILGVGALAIAHINRLGDSQRPFGSVYWHNGARATWFVKASDRDNQQALDVTFLNRKANLERRERPLGFRLSFEPKVTRIEKTKVSAAANTALTLRERIYDAVRQKPKTYAELAQQLDTDAGTIRVTVSRYPNAFYVQTRTPDGIHRVAISTKRALP